MSPSSLKTSIRTAHTANMSRFTFAAFAFVVLFSLATAANCPSNEVWEECGTACPPTCENPNPQNCTLQCVQGCYCEDGLVRNSKGKCIPQDKCNNDN